MPRIYEGARSKDGAQVRVRFDHQGAQHTRTLDPRHDLRNHSPDGFEWGYSGSGPAQLALALCADVLDDDQRAMRVYQGVKSRLVAPIQGDDWQLSDTTILNAVLAVEDGQQQSA